MDWGLFKTARSFEPFSADLEHLILKFLAVCQNNFQTESILRSCLNNSLYKNILYAELWISFLVTHCKKMSCIGGHSILKGYCEFYSSLNAFV